MMSPFGVMYDILAHFLDLIIQATEYHPENWPQMTDYLQNKSYSDAIFNGYGY